MSDLLTAQLQLTGRLTTASNATFLGTIDGAVIVYKPIAGENPLWDFPHGTLAHREVAAYLVSQVLGWQLVPHTWLRDGPHGVGMVQLFQQQDPTQHPVDLIPAALWPSTTLKKVLEGHDENGKPVALVHEDSTVLRQMAVFDLIVNNADRKGDHILPMEDGHRYGVDHGVTFHPENKLRTVLWGWLGEELSAEELAGVTRVLAALDAQLGEQLGQLLAAEELSALVSRCEQLRSTRRFPAPSPASPALPWPLF